MKTTLYRILAALLLISSLFLTGCGGFFQEETILIDYVTDPVELQNGNILVEIYYKDDVIPKTRIEVPKGKQGDDGVAGIGIEKIDATYNAEKKVTDILVTYTDGEEMPFSIPDGVSVVNTTEPEYDENGDLYFYFMFSDTRTSNKIYLPKGDAGNGIKNFTINNETMDGSIIVSIELDKPVGEGDNAQSVFEFVIPAGKEGTGIKKVESNVEGELYFLDVWFTGDDLEQPAPTRLYFPRPKDPNQWYKGNAKPSDTFGNIGDFFYDDTNKVIYHKEEIDGKAKWILSVSFKVTNTIYNVTFNFNVTDNSVVWPDDVSISSSRPIKAGTYFWDVENGNESIPIPVRPGYTFGGWYRRAIPEGSKPYPTEGAFTDLTPVFSDLTLYAYWIPNEN